jgi:hypothetical protein
VYGNEIDLLNGYRSYNRCGDHIAYLWRKIKEPYIKLDDATSSSSIFIAPSDITNDNKRLC